MIPFESPPLITLYVLIAEGNPEESRAIQNLIYVSIDQMASVKIQVNVVNTLSEVLGCQRVNAILLYLDLKDASLDEIVDAIPTMPEPVIVVLDQPDPVLQARIKTKGAQVMVLSLTKNSDICSYIIQGLTKSAVKSHNELPSD